MQNDNQTVLTRTGAKEVVLACIQALNNEDFEKARRYVSDDMKFEGVLGSRNGGDVYFVDMKKMKFKYSIKKTFEDNNDVCLMYEVAMDGLTVFCCGWYHVKNGKINSLKVVFDPRPLLEKSQRK